LKGLFQELKRLIKGPIQLHCDNQGAITTAYNLALYNCIKHTLLKYHYICEQVKDNLVNIIYFDIVRMPIDGLTKPLPSIKYKAFLDLLGLDSFYLEL